MTDSEGGFDSLQTAATHTCNFNGVAPLKKKKFFFLAPEYYVSGSRRQLLILTPTAAVSSPHALTTCLPALQSRVGNTSQYSARSPSSWFLLNTTLDFLKIQEAYDNLTYYFNIKNIKID